VTRDRFVIGTRASALARAQADWVATRLQTAWPELRIDVRTFSTAGDRDTSTPIPAIGGKGLFTADIERQLRSESIDAAVHSLKDLPTESDDGLELLAIPTRADPGDVLVLAPGLARAVEGLGDLAAAATVGTSSIRRAAQVAAFRPDLRVEPLRGNVETRVARLEAGEFDAIILAAAGLLRLGLDRCRTIPLAPPAWLPAPGQGALAVQGRAADARARRLLAAIDDPVTRTETTAERSFLHRLEGGCHVPVAALAEYDGSRLTLDGAVYAVGPGSTPLTGRERGASTEAAAIGERLAERFFAAGVSRLLAGAPAGDGRSAGV
jgi:hydroxymethylbilane synthase